MVPILAPEIWNEIWFSKLEFLRPLGFRNEFLRQGKWVPGIISVIEITRKISWYQDLCCSKYARLLRGREQGGATRMCNWQLGGGEHGGWRRRGQEGRGKQGGWRLWRGETLSEGDVSGEIEPRNTRNTWIHAIHYMNPRNTLCKNVKLQVWQI